MEKPTIGLSQRFQPAAGAAAASTVLSGTASGTAAKGKNVFTALDWKIKMVVLLLVAALVYFLVVRYLKKKGKVGKGEKAGEDAAKAKDAEDRNGEKS